MRKILWRLVMVVGMVAAGGLMTSPQLVGGVVIQSGYMNVQARSNGNVQSKNRAIPTASTIDTFSATLGTLEEYSSASSINYQFSDGGATFSHDLTQRHAGGTGVESSFSLTMWFSVSRDMSYSLSGWYSLGHSGPAGGYADLQTSFYDYPNYLNTLNYSSQTNGGGPGYPQDVTLGLVEAGTGGMGSLTGTLQAGVTYIWSFGAFTSTSGPDHTIDAGNARGNVTLVLGDGGLPAAPVPEPDSLVIFSLSSLVAAGVRAHRRNTPSTGSTC